MVTYNSNDRGVFRALADATRRRILVLLGEGPLSVGEIALAFPVSRPAISKHLRILEQARLVSEVRDGRRHVYQVDPGPLAAVRSWVEGVQPADDKPLEKKTATRARRTEPAAKQEPVVAATDDWKQW